jgi:DNA polymerase I-like protein with 3'-5' exonuclease and polymerase domains
VKKPVIDFETEGIEGRPKYPPKPVGVAIKLPGKKSRYYSWGHPTGNNATYEDAKRELAPLWDHAVQHNSKFDLDVGRTHFGFDWPAADGFEDTMLMAYLVDPHAKRIDLKTLSEQLLGRPPEERDVLQEWVLVNVTGAKKSDWGKYIALAPGDLAGTYACADVDMTYGIHDVLQKKIKEYGMSAAYHREKALLTVLNGMEERGIPVDLELLERELVLYRNIEQKITNWLYKYLGVPEFNIDSADELADALDKSGKAQN